MSSAVQMQLQVHSASGTDATHSTVVWTGVSVCTILDLSQPALVLAAHVVRLQVHSAGRGYVTDGAVMRPAGTTQASRQAVCGRKGLADPALTC